MSIRLSRRLFLLALGASLLAPTGARAQSIDPELQAVYSGLPTDGRAEVIVTFHGHQRPSAADLDVLRGVGIQGGVTLHALPVVGTLATWSQVQALSQHPRVRSVFWNKEIELYNYDARHLTGVERVRSNPHLTRLNRGLPVSGRGVGVLINDSGIDATHPDLKLGKNVKQNVAALADRNLLSGTGFTGYVVVENQPLVDFANGHGTHVAGTVAGTGQASAGTHAGVAPGADLVGYGFGNPRVRLTVLGGFDYAIANRSTYNIRVINNSWGSSGGFEPDNPINVATRLADSLGIVVVFAAGNSGPGIDTHNPYAKAPWVVSVAAGQKNGHLASFSSRGTSGGAKTVRSRGGEVITYFDEPTVTAPGVDIMSARATTSTLGSVGDPYYQRLSGTSMASPHVAGIVALMLEANPLLTPAQVRQILKETATRMPGHHAYEVGAGYVNAFAAVQKAFDLSTPFGKTLQEPAVISGSREQIVMRETYNHSPLATTPYLFPFDVSAGAGILQVRIDYNGLEVAGENLDNPLYLEVTAPNGVRYASYQLFFALYNPKNLSVVVNNPIPGRWVARVEMIPARGNTATFPDTVTVTSKLTWFDPPQIGDIAGHPALGAIQFALTNGFMRLCGTASFCPDQAITRAQFARSFTQFGAVRQFLPFNNGSTFADVAAADRPFVEAVAARGAALRDREFRFGGVIEGSGGSFNPGGGITRAEIAQMLVRGVGGEATALAHSGDVTVLYNGTTHVVADQDQIPAALRGYAHVAINSNMLNVHWVLEQGPYDLAPVLRPYFRPANAVTRADAAVAISRYYTQYFR